MGIQFKGLLHYLNKIFTRLCLIFMRLLIGTLTSITCLDDLQPCCFTRDHRSSYYVNLFFFIKTLFNSIVVDFVCINLGIINHTTLHIFNKLQEIPFIFSCFPNLNYYKTGWVFGVEASRSTFSEIIESEIIWVRSSILVRTIS